MEHVGGLAGDASDMLERYMQAPLREARTAVAEAKRKPNPENGVLHKKLLQLRSTLRCGVEAVAAALSPSSLASYAASSDEVYTKAIDVAAPAAVGSPMKLTMRCVSLTMVDDETVHLQQLRARVQRVRGVHEEDTEHACA